MVIAEDNPESLIARLLESDGQPVVEKWIKTDDLQN